jgi:hypothetical protein
MRSLAQAFVLSGSCLASLPALAVEPNPKTTAPKPQACRADFDGVIVEAKTEKTRVFSEFKKELAQQLKICPEARERYLHLIEKKHVEVVLAFPGQRKCGRILPADFMGWFKVHDGKMNIILNETFFNQQLVYIKLFPELAKNPAKNLARAWQPIFFHELEHALNQQNLNKKYGISKHDVPFEEEEVAYIRSAGYSFQARAGHIKSGCSKQEIAFFDKCNFMLWNLRPGLMAKNFDVDGALRELCNKQEALLIKDFYSDDRCRLTHSLDHAPVSKDQACAELKLYYDAEKKAALKTLSSAMKDIRSQPAPSDWVNMLDKRIKVK